MAYERNTTKAKGDSLDAFVSNLSDTFSNQMKIRNAQEELAFNTSVINNGLSVEDQLAYRKEQLKKVSDDPTEKARIKSEINSLTSRVAQKKYSDAYLEKLMNYESGLSSIDAVISFLNEQKASATDEAIINNINQELVTKTQEKYNLTTKLIEDKTTYAINDKSLDVIDEQIAKVRTEKSKALLANNATVVASLDLQLQSLNKARNETSIEKDIQNFASYSITGYSSAIDLLDSYNDSISNATDDTPVTIGGTTYSSAKEFWTYKRDSYLADSSASGLFGRLDNEVKDDINTAYSKNKLDVKTLNKYTDSYSNLEGRPELAGYEAKIEASKQSSLQQGANLITDTISSRYSTDYDLNKAVKELNSLKNIGVNIDDAYSKIITAGASIKSGQINSILSAAQNALSNDPNMSPEDAINMALSSGASIVKSPTELANTNEKDLAKDLATTSKNEAGAIDPRLTINKDVVLPTTTTAPEKTTSGYKTITVNPGESLSVIAQRELGSSAKYTEIAKLNNITDPNKIKSGQVLKIPVSTPTTTQEKTQTTTTPVKTTTTPAKTTTPTKTTTPVKTTTTPAKTTTPTPNPPKATYNGSSIVDYLGSVGQDSSYSARAKIAASKGIANYTGSASQNTQLLKALRGF